MTEATAPEKNALRAPSLHRRMACWLYEGVLLFGVVVLSGLFFSILVQQRHALWHRHGMQAFQFAVLALYFTVFWRRGGQTLAMKTWRIRLIDTAGRPVSSARALLRYLLCWLWFLPPMSTRAIWPTLPALEVCVLLGGWICVWALLSNFHPQRQFWHDALAGTRLVEVPFEPGKQHSIWPLLFRKKKTPAAD